MRCTSSPCTSSLCTLLPCTVVPPCARLLHAHAATPCAFYCWTRALGSPAHIYATTSVACVDHHLVSPRTRACALSLLATGKEALGAAVAS
jgi:hypothetical protein